MAALGAARCLFRSFSRLKNVQKSKHLSLTCCTRALCNDTQDRAPSDIPQPKITDPVVQDILTRLTGLDLQKVFRPIKQELKPPKYKLMTDEQLQQAVEFAKEEAKKLLKMPPFLPERKPIDDVLCDDKFLDGMDTAKYVFTDITYNVPHRERFIVVREPNGVLRKATWEERDRLIQVYFPKQGRQLRAPLIFQDKNLKTAFSQDHHEYVLNLCLAQFEPDSANYIKIHALTYEDLDKHGKYELLYSTRHFGGMVWYLVGACRVDGLIVHMLQKERLEDAVSLVSLFNIIHPHSESALEAARQQATGTDLLKIYAQRESQRAGYLELALQAYEQTEATSTGA